MEKVFYVRVSTQEQNTDRQIFTREIKMGVTIVQDKCSGSVSFAEREGGKKVLSMGDLKELHVHSIDRLGRNSLDILQTIQTLTKKGVNVISEKEGLQTLIEGKENPIAKLMIGILGTLAEFELNRIKERQAEGIAAAKTKGKYNGRPVGSAEDDEKFLSKYPKVVKALKNGESVNSIANSKIMNVSRMTVIKIKKILNK
jgi:DNA invertase Pin-like site-specific DNA recombinase